MKNKTTKCYRVPKGTLLTPMSIKDFKNRTWQLVKVAPGPPLPAKEDWYFTEKDILPYPYEAMSGNIPFYVKIEGQEDGWNAFSVQQKDVGSVGVEWAPDDEYDLDYEYEKRIHGGA